MPKPGRGSVREVHPPGAQEQGHSPGLQERGYQAQASELVVLLRLLRTGVRTLIIASFRLV